MDNGQHVFVLQCDMICSCYYSGPVDALDTMTWINSSRLLTSVSCSTSTYFPGMSGFSSLVRMWLTEESGIKDVCWHTWKSVGVQLDKMSVWCYTARSLVGGGRHLSLRGVFTVVRNLPLMTAATNGFHYCTFMIVEMNRRAYFESLHMWGIYEGHRSSAVRLWLKKKVVNKAASKDYFHHWVIWLFS